LIIDRIEERLGSGTLSAAIVGFGYIGTCIGAVLAQRGIRVLGIDTSAKLVGEINAGTTSFNEPGLVRAVAETVAAGCLSASTQYEGIRDADVVILTVGTPLGESFDPDLRHIEAASRELARHLRAGQLVILKSTIPPLTTERVVKPLLDASGVAPQDYHLAFCPERLAEGNALHEFRTIPVVVGGVDEASTEAVSRFWSKALGVATVKVHSARAAEMTKLADNLWIDLNIALANEIAMLCDKLDMDALEVIAAANTLPKAAYNVNILVPSMGVGGYCLTKDPWFVRHLGEKYGLDIKTPVVSRTVNDTMPRYTFEVIRSQLALRGRPLDRAKVAVLGIAFKSNTGDCRYTPTKATIELLERSGCELAICDPLVNAEDAATVTSHKLSASIEEAMSGADCLAFLTGHAQFRAFPLERMAQLARPGATVLDGRIFYRHEEIAKIRALGMHYKGIGR
jgi:dTDP-alpha-D-glucose dehydrogenase